MHLRSILRTLLIAAIVLAPLTSCKTAPKYEDRDDLLARSRSTRAWFERSVRGLDAQIEGSAGYIVFPDVAQWGIIFGGGTAGGGVLFDANGKQLGWSRINTGSIGLQAGLQGFRILMVLENETTLRDFKEGKWTGSANGVAVAGGAGGSGRAPFTNGVALYEGHNEGLMAGVNIGLNNIRFVALGQEDR